MLLILSRRALVPALALLVLDSIGCGSDASAPSEGNPTTGGSSGMGAGGAMAGAGGMTAGSGGIVVGGSGGIAPGGSGGVPPGGAGGVPPGGAGGSMPNVFDAGSDPLRNRVPAGMVCDRFSTVLCAAEQYCCTNPGRDFNTCKGLVTNLCANELYLDIVSASPLTGYNIDRAEAAFTEFERLASMCDPTVAQWGTTANGLRGITQGTIAPNGTCTPPLLDMAQQAPYLVSCTMPETHACLPGQFPTDDWTCAQRGGQGSRCLTDLNCVDGLYCPTGMIGATCIPRKPDGQPCGSTTECASLLCEGGVCVAANQQTAYCVNL